MKHLTKKQVCELARIEYTYELPDHAEIIGCISQNNFQYYNTQLTLYLLQSTAEMILHEDDGDHSEYYQVHRDDLLNGSNNTADTTKFLENCAERWAASETDNEQLERLAWELDTLEEVEVGTAYHDKVKIIEQQYFFAHDPIDFVRCLDGGAIIFDNYVKAVEWIENEQLCPHILSSDETRKPTYTIVAA